MNRKREKIITSCDKEFAEYLVKWIAWSIQNLDKHAEVALWQRNVGEVFEVDRS